MAAQLDKKASNRTLSHAFAARLAASRAQDPTPEDIAKAKLCIMDFLACAFESQTLPWSRQAISIAKAHSGNEHAATAGIVGTSLRAPILDAAFANAVLGHGLVRDDMHLGSVSHLGVAVIPTALAIAEKLSVSGIALLSAIVSGYEAGGKFGRTVLDVDVSRIHRPTGISGPIAAAAAGAALLSLDANEFAHALALAANTIAGYNEWAETGGSEMFFHPGFAVRNALTSLELAQAGAFASPTAFDGEAGVLAAFRKLGTADRPLPYDGTSEIQAVFFKEVPACNFAQSAAQAARDIAVEQVLALDRIDHIVARVSYAAAHYPGCDASGPFEHVLQAKMSIQYNVAAALATGSFDENNYHPDRQPDIVKLAEKVSIEIDDDLTRAFPAQQGAEIRIDGKQGLQLVRRVEDVAPASNELVRSRLIAAATRTIGGARTDELMRFIADIEQSDDAGSVVSLSQIAA